MKKLNVVDLFAGCGGFSYGFQQAGYSIKYGVDNDQKALDTFILNHENSQALNVDLSSQAQIKKLANKINNESKIDIIIAGPPCQGFSLTGTRNENDKRNKLFYSVFDIANLLSSKPEVIIIENVPGLVKLFGGKAKKDIIEHFDLNDYNCTVQELFAPDYGIPQIRRRVFFVGVLKKYKEFNFPAPIIDDTKYVTCEEAIGDLPSLEKEVGNDFMKYDTKPLSKFQKIMRQGSKSISNHIGTVHTEYVKSVIRQVPEGGNYKDLPPGVGESRKFNEAWTRYHSQKPSRTIDTGHRNHFHYKYDRVPTVRENARLQSFPDVFKFLGNKTEQYRQVGNAVPPMLGKVIADELLLQVFKGKGKNL